MDRDIDKNTALLYFEALDQLKNEGNAFDYLTFPDWGCSSFVGADLMEWASNIHHNVWDTNSLGALLKSHVVLMRIKGTDHET